MIDRSGVSYRLTPMGTVVETETMDEALKIIGEAYKQLEGDCNRIYSSLKFDIRKDKSHRLTQKIESVEKRLNRSVQT